MELEKLHSAFERLLSSARTIIVENKIQPTIRLTTCWKVDELKATETGVHPASSHSEYIEKQDWYKAAHAVVEELKTHQSYGEFRDLLALSTGVDVSQKLDNAMSILVEKLFDGQEFNNQEVLGFLLKAIRGEPVPAWSEIDVCGIATKKDGLTLSFPNRRLIFRHLKVADFEEGFLPEIGRPRDRFVPPPGCILKIELNTTRSWDLQLEGLRALALLRLARVCAVDFGQQTHGTHSPFPFIGIGIGGTMWSGRIRRGRHDLILSVDSESSLQRFWEAVEPKLPLELYDFTNKDETPLRIAYERYCESLFTGAGNERAIAYAIMGLEALYLRRDEVQELMYRLPLRVSKALSKLNMPADEVHTRIKEGYRIRNVYVHGGHLAKEERKKLENKGLTLENLNSYLLNCLRISMLHLICSGQNKSEFLDLIEESLLNREQDDALGALLKREHEILCCEIG